MSILWLLGSLAPARAQVVPLPPTPALREGAPVAALQRDLNDIFADPHFLNAIWGVSVQSLQTGETLYEMNAEKSLLPASNFKVVTAAEALSLLTPEFRYTTQLLTTGRISDGVLHGDLIIRGAGDPTFGSASMYPDSSPTWILDHWADTLKRMGINRIDGSIIGDDTYFSEDVYPYGWAIEDIPYYYAMQTSALAYGENAVTVSVSPGLSPGSAIQYELNPSTDFVSVINRGKTKADSIVLHRRHAKDSVLELGATTIDVTRDPGGNEVLIRGEIPASAPVTYEQLSLENPTLYTMTLLSEALEERGVKFSGRLLSARDLAKPIPYLRARVLASYTSPPLSEIIRVMNKESNNFYAEQIFRTVAKETGGEGSWRTGVEVMKRYMASLGIDTANVADYDGSGLSRMDLISPTAMVKVLRAMHERKKLSEPFFNSLPIMGVDGTLKNRLRDTRAEGNVHAKTGFVTEVRSISGYLTTKDGEPLVFSMMCNNSTAPVSQANNTQDLAILRLVNFSRK